MNGPQGSECECGNCHQTFTGIGLFDAHQDVDYRRQAAVICRPPAALGLAQNARGTWGTPEALAARARSGTRLAAARSKTQGQAVV